jgi:plasmid stabilization system protein ParE
VKHSVSLSGRAEADLTNQYRWYLDHSTTAVAERFLKTFDARTTLLAAFPDIGQPRRFRAPELQGVRSLSVGIRFGDHLIFYRADAKTISVERVMHGARDLERRLLEAPENYPDA